MSEAVTARAPGKLILCGEHAVVHGCAAVAMAVNRFAECSVTPLHESRLTIDAPAFCDGVDISLAEAEETFILLRGRYQEFLAGRRAVRELLDDSGQFLIFAAMRALEGGEWRVGMHLRVATDLPVGCGMGSSAAVASSVIQAVGRLAGQRFDPSDLYERVMDCERLQHGRPSGVDAYASIYGGCMTYRKGGAIQPLALKDFAVTLAQTGTPEASTGECVDQVTKRFGTSEIWTQFEQVAEEMAAALTRGETVRLPPLIRRNHRLLVEIGVVPERVQRFVEAVEERGGAAKICGAGSVRGDGGGMVWVFSDRPPETWTTEFAYPVLSACQPVECGMQPCRTDSVTHEG
ncbi:MAG: hypothetical protein PHP44_01220 [Kiritimatiellae bacterium]|nr:hypothetical protein [Kiritimatiellia bacterium]